MRSSGSTGGGSDKFMLTQEFLAHMLGVHRPTVSETAQRQQSDGLIRYSRGVINVLDGDRLAHRACECYQIVKAESDDFHNGPRPSSNDYR